MDYFESWLKDKAKRDNQTTYTPPKPKKGDSKKDIDRSTGYKWQTQLLRPMSTKKYGRKYEDKFNSAMREIGVTDQNEISNFKRWMNSQENTTFKHRVKANNQRNKLNQTAQSIFSDMNKTVESKAKQMSLHPQQAKKQKSLTPKVEKKNGFEKVMDTINAPLKAFDKSIYQPIEKKAHRFATSLVDGEVLGQFKKNALTGGKALGLEAPKFVQEAVSKPKSKTDKVIDTIGEFAGMAAPISTSYKVTSPLIKPLAKVLPEVGKLGVASKIGQTALRGGLGMGAYGTAREGLDEAIHPNDANFAERAKNVRNDMIAGAVLDPAFSVGGAAVKKGFESASNRAMKNLLPKAEQVQKGLDELVKTKKAETALPIKTMDELIPKGNDITNSEFLPKLNPKESIKVETPKVNARPLEEILANPKDIPKEDVLNIDNLVPPVNQEIPKATAQMPKQPNERAFFNTVQNPDKLSPELKAKLDEFDKTYKPMSNQELVDYANEYVKNDMEKAYQFVKNAKKFDPRHVTVGHRLIDELQKSGQYDRALDVVERLAEQGTKAGQSIQSYSIYNRLTAEGQLLRAQRHINKINENIADPAKHIKLTEQNIQDITHTADSIQRFAGQMEQASNVMSIMEKVKKGEQATDAELETVRSFVSDAKKFFGDLDPNVTAPKVKTVKDIRTRDKVVDFMSKKEDVARKELQKIFGRANSLPVDAFYHLSVIGASKIAKGTVKLSDFTESMVKDFGEVIRPYAKQLYNKAVETFNLQSESMTKQRLSEVEKITNKALKDKNLSMDEVETIKEFARKVGQMSGDAKLESSMELQSVLQALEVPTFGQKLSTAQTIAQLLNPKTIVRNAIGNELFYRVEQMNKLIATPIDMLRSKITGGERTITFVTHNQGEYWRNWLTGAKAGWKGVNPMGLQTQYDLGPQAFRSKWNPLTYLEKTLGATLRSFDHAGYMRAYNKTLGELASIRAMNEGLTGTAKKEAIARYIREADENAIQIADQYGKYATFQDNTPLSVGLTKLKRTMNKYSTGSKDFGLGDMVLKYPKTPANLVMRALEYSPAGVIRGFSLLKGLKKSANPLISKEATLAFTRAITGTTGFSLLGYVLADKGILTSSGDSDYEVASLERNAGKQPNSVNVSALMRFINSGFNLNESGTKEGDTFISYDWAQPISIAVALGTGVQQSSKETGKIGLVSGAQGAFDSATNTIINQSVLKGLNDFLASYPGRTMSDRFGDAAKGSLGSFVPTASNQVRQLSDNTARTTYSPNFLPEIKNRTINRIPILQNSLPPAYDTLGNKRQTFQDKGNNLFNVFLNPSFVSKYKPSPEAQMVLNLINQTGDKTLAPRIAQKKIDGKALTTEQYAEYQRIMGEEARAGLMDLYASGETDQEALSKKIDKILREAGKKAREQLRQEMGD